jgi:hypothetical protein
MAREQRVDRGIDVARPTEQIGAKAAQAAARGQRVAHAAVVETERRIALGREPLREVGVVVLLDAHRAGDQHSALGLVLRRVVAAAQCGRAFIGAECDGVRHRVRPFRRCRLRLARCRRTS